MGSSQLLKGVLEGCVLALIGRGETYGYELVSELDRYGFHDVAEGTLYPLLMRLEKRGAIRATYRASEKGPRRKYYAVTKGWASGNRPVRAGILRTLPRGGAGARLFRLRGSS